MLGWLDQPITHPVHSTLSHKGPAKKARPVKAGSHNLGAGKLRRITHQKLFASKTLANSR